MNRRTHGQLPLADRRYDGIYRPAADAPFSDRVRYAAKFFLSLILFYDSVNEQRNIRYFENRQDGKNVEQTVNLIKMKLLFGSTFIF